MRILFSNLLSNDRTHLHQEIDKYIDDYGELTIELNTNNPPTTKGLISNGHTQTNSDVLITNDVPTTSTQTISQSFTFKNTKFNSAWFYEILGYSQPRSRIDSNIFSNLFNAIDFNNITWCKRDDVDVSTASQNIRSTIQYVEFDGRPNPNIITYIKLTRVYSLDNTDDDETNEMAHVESKPKKIKRLDTSPRAMSDSPTDSYIEIETICDITRNDAYIYDLYVLFLNIIIFRRYRHSY